MFPRDRRIRAGNDIITVLRRGIRRSHGVVACSFLGKPDTLGRIAVIVDTKVSKRSVVRNLLKRQVRALLREMELPSGDLVVRLWKGAENSQFRELQEGIQQCLKTLR